MGKKRFIFDEAYVKKYEKEGKAKLFIFGGIALFLILIIIIVVLATRDRNRRVVPVVKEEPKYELLDELVVEAGSYLPEAADYFKVLENVDEKDITLTYPDHFEVSYDTSECSVEELETINELDHYDEKAYKCAKKVLKEVNTYGIGVSVADKEYTVNLVIQDTTAPTVLTKGLEIFSGESYKIEDFVSVCSDVSDVCELSYAEALDENGRMIDYSAFKEVGEYTVKIQAVDAYNNKSAVLDVKLTIKKPDKPLITVTFNSDGGSEVKSKTIESGSIVSVPLEPTKDGYIFDGWYQGDVKFDFTQKVDNNLTLTAKWIKIEEPIEDPNGGGGSQEGPKPPSVVSVRSVSLNYLEIYLYEGQSKTVSATVKPDNATNKTVSWSSSDNSVATVKNGVITGVKEGNATITATAGGKSAQVKVVVSKKVSNTCQYGDKSYNSGKYILSYDVTKNGCAVDPNSNPNESATVSDYTKAYRTLVNMGFDLSKDNVFSHQVVNLVKIKNNSGTGLVGYQITIRIRVVDLDNAGSVMTAEYIIRADGSRQFINNNIQKNGIKFN